MTLKKTVYNFRKNLAKRTVLLRRALLNPKRKKIFTAGLAGVAILVFFYFTKSLFIAALVNSKPITRFSLIKSLEKQGGQQALDNLVIKELISQEAKKKGIVVKEEDIQTEIDNIRGVVEEQGSSLEAALAFQGQTMDDLKDTLYLKLNVERILGDQVSVSEEEITKYYEDNKTTFGTNKLEEVKDQIRDQLIQERLGTKFQEWITEVKNNSNIKYFVNF